MKTLTALFLLSSSILLGGCAKMRCDENRNHNPGRCGTVNTSDCGIQATVKDLTGLDGCGLVLELPDKTRLEPTNLKDFNSNLKDGDKVMIGYQPDKNAASVCMVGQLVKLTCLQVTTTSK